MPRVLLTGATGFLGAHLARALAARDDDLHLIMRRESDRSRLAGADINYATHECDLTDFASVQKTLRAIRPDRIFHLAAYGAGHEERDPTRLFASNVLAAHHLLEASRSLSIERLVYTGGSSEYGHHDEALTENHPLRPATPYASAKAAATLLFQRAAGQDGLPIVVLRPFSIYGPLETSSRLIPTAIRAALEGKSLPMTDRPFVRDFVFVEDVVDACLAAAESAAAEGETFNIGTGIETSNHDVPKVIERVTGQSIELRLGEYEAHPSDTYRWLADPTKANETLGWTAKTSFADGVRQTVEEMARAESSR